MRKQRLYLQRVRILGISLRACILGMSFPFSLADNQGFNSLDHSPHGQAFDLLAPLQFDQDEVHLVEPAPLSSSPLAPPPPPQMND